MQVRHPEWAMCLGGASCVWDDVAAWQAEYGAPWDGIVIAANDIGAHWPGRLDHWVSLHPYKLAEWRTLRAANQCPDTPYETWGQKFLEPDGVAVDHRLMPWPGGSSGMFAAQVAREVGCTKIVLCGVPITPTPHFAESRETFHKQWLASVGHWRGWERARSHDVIHPDWLRSISGRTKDLLGAPTRAWLIG